MKKLFYIFAVMMVMACGVKHPNVPEQSCKEDRCPRIFPEYTDVTIPCNIAPLNFRVKENGTQCVVRFSVNELSYTYGEDMKVIIDEDEWKELLNTAKGNSIKVEVFTQQDNDLWKAYKPFNIYVTEDSIDEYISYRLIKPSYVAYELLTINQRNLTNYDETVIYNNMLVSTEAVGQCINCHSYRNHKTDNMQFHMRQGLGGTMIVHNGDVKKVDLKTDSTLSAGVYPAWHPTEEVIAYSTKKTGQSFHTKLRNKIEVQDTESDLILYDVNTDEVSHISCYPNELEVFPAWDADGKYLYFCSAHYERQDTGALETEMIKRYTQIQYNLYRKEFDLKKHTFGPTELIYDARSKDRSVTLPRVSPDNRYMLFAEGNYGCFHVWHPDADIMILNMTTMEVKPLTELNSDQSESYPVWSSNGRWIMAASRRDDGNYTRPYIAYFDKKGKCHKPFEVPQRDPDFYTFQSKSFNRPEFMVEAVKITPQEFAKVAKTDAIPAKFKPTNVKRVDAISGASKQQ